MRRTTRDDQDEELRIRLMEAAGRPRVKGLHRRRQDEAVQQHRREQCR